MERMNERNENENENENEVVVTFNAHKPGKQTVMRFLLNDNEGGYSSVTIGRKGRDTNPLDALKRDIRECKKFFSNHKEKAEVKDHMRAFFQPPSVLLSVLF